jgi:hypothetical protein
VPALVSGGKLLVKDGADPLKRKILWLSKGAAIDVTTGGGFDPVTNGATLTITNANGTGETETFALPASGWIAKGVPPKIVLKYGDKLALAGPCKVGLVKNLTLLKVSCVGKLAPINYSLDEPSQGAIAMRLTSGPASFCAVFGGVVKDLPGVFSAKKPPAPPTCPTP